MLANGPDRLPQIGVLSSDVQKPATFRNELLNFIGSELPAWRGRTDRKAETSETILTSQLCAHLNSATRHAPGWDILQFRVEEADQNQRGRKIDLVASPSGCAIVVEGRRHIDFDSLMPLECKRLPTPKQGGRDEREYVFCKDTTTGGIQRFKAGHHGSGHTLGAMIGYVQEGTCEGWNDSVAGWIKGLVGVEAGWTDEDLLCRFQSDDSRHLATLRSTHSRRNGLPPIELQHFWIVMN
jgi:hypothetical protein